jgi:hypothetical protein
MAARERKIEDRVARSVVREMSVGENYERNITPIRSDISRFSRSTVPGEKPKSRERKLRRKRRPGNARAD